MVCQRGDGRLVTAAQLGSFEGHRKRYMVNMAEHFRTEDITLPARDDVFEFQGTVDIGWRVVDPVSVVARNIVDGLALVRSTLLIGMRQISRCYPVEQCAAADEEINRMCGNAPIMLPEGLCVYRFALRLRLDEQTRSHLQELQNARYESQIEQVRIDATRRALDGDNALLVWHLVQHRGDTGSIIKLIAHDRESSEQQRSQLLKDLLAQGVVQDADLDDLARALIERSTDSVLHPVAGQPQITPSTVSGQFPAVNVAQKNGVPSGSGADGTDIEGG
jgi:hypothetical protein